MNTKEQVELQVNALEIGNSLLTRVRKVNGGKVEIELAEVIKQNSGINVAALLNEGDDRFSQSNGARRAWMSAEPKKVSELFGIEMSSLEGLMLNEELFVGQMNPSYNGMIFRVQISETTKGTTYQLANIDKKAKKAGADGDFLYYKGKHIFSNTVITLAPKGENPVHTILEHDKPDTETGELVSASEASAEPTL